jgi:rubrerythrin
LLADVLNYALTLEHLEAAFYQEGLKNYTQADFVKAGFKDPFYANLQEVASDETEHVSFLTSALKGMSPLPITHTEEN